MFSKSITDLAASITSNTERYNSYLVQNDLPLPTHGAQKGYEQVLQLPDEIASARDAAISASYELHELLIGPYGIVLNSLFSMSRILALKFINTYNIEHSFAVGESSTFAKIAKCCNLNEEDVGRMLRLAMTHNIFAEPNQGEVVHTTTSQALSENHLLKAWVGVAADEIWPGFLQTTKAISTWPGTQDPTKTAFSLAHGFKEDPFTEWERDPPRAKRFSDSMKFLHSDYHNLKLLSNYPFSKQAATILVDVGGSHGAVAFDLAEKYPTLKCIVQDLPTVVANTEDGIPIQLKDRVMFMAHDFWEEQPVKNADVYLFRWIFHDWSQEFSIKILRNLIPALKPGARIVINDACVPPPGVFDRQQEIQLRTVDILMKSFTNAKERDAKDWEILFQEADPRFCLLGITVPLNARSAIIEAQWEPEASLPHKNTG